MFTAIVVVWITSAAVSITIVDEPPRPYKTEKVCMERVQQIVEYVKKLQPQAEIRVAKCQ